MGAVGALLARSGICPVLRRSRPAGQQSGLEQLPRYGHRLRNRGVDAARLATARGNGLMTTTRDRGSRPSERDDDVERIMRRTSRRSFFALGLSAAAGL